MFRMLLILTFVLVLAIGAVSSIPLSFAMRVSGLAERGLSWQQARGTIWNGQVSGLASNGVNLGSVRVHAHASKLLLGKPAAEIQLSGGALQGRIDATVASQSVSFSDLSLNANLAELSNLKPELQRAGGTLSIRGSRFSAGKDGTCATAAGTATLDTVQRIGISYGRDWPILSGDITCDTGTFLTKLSGKGQANEQFDLTVRLLESGATQIEIRAANLDPDAAQLLSVLGFLSTPEGLVFYQDTSLPK